MTAVQPIRSTDRLDQRAVTDVLALAAVVDRADGVHPLSEDVVLRLRGAAEPDGDASGDATGTGVVHLLAVSADGDLAGYAFLDLSGDAGPAGELFVHPGHRRRGLGRALVTTAIATAERAEAAGPLRFWAHGDHPAAGALAARTGFHRVRVLWQMRRSLAVALPDVPLPEGVQLRAFQPGADESGWLTVNALAFAHHPEQGRWTLEDLRLRMAEPWFDPAGFLLAVDRAEGTMLGFHWTKVHPAQLRADGTQQEPIGEIYVLGVDPGGHRRGLGAALSVAGLRHLHRVGLTEAMLYVDESNTAAVTLYDRLGFTVWSTDVSYQRSS